MNAARLSFHGQEDTVGQLIVPLYRKMRARVFREPLEHIGRVTQHSKARLYRAMDYLAELAGDSLEDEADEKAKAVLTVLGASCQNPRKRTRLTGAHREFYSMLASLNISFQTEKAVCNYLVDAYLEPKIVVALDGAESFYSGTSILESRKLMESDVMRQKGHEVVRVAYEELETPEGRKDAMARVLEKLNMEDKYV